MLTNYFVMGSQLSLPANANRQVPSVGPVALPVVPSLPETTETSVYDSVSDTVKLTLNSPNPTVSKQPIAAYLISVPIPTSGIPQDAQGWMDASDPNKNPTYKRSRIDLVSGNPGPYSFPIFEQGPCGGQVILEFTR